MEDKKLLFPLLLFGIFFVLIAITGFFQITIIKRNIEGLLRSEGETLFRSIAREIEMNMEYLTLIEKSPSIITPNFLNVMTYDEAIVDDLYSQFTKSTEADLNASSLTNILVTDRAGKQLMRKGSIKVSKEHLDLLEKKERQTVIRMPSGEDHSLFMGIKLPDRLIFFNLTPTELENLRKVYVMKTILENEQKRLDIAEINIYDASGNVYLGSEKRPKDVFSIMKPLNSNYFPNYSMEILVSNKLASDTFKRTSVNFVMLLFFLMLGGAGGIYVIFRLDRKHAERLSEIEKDMVIKERLVSLGKLASGMAHEIRNPLNAMSISIQRLKREFVPEQEKKDEYYRFLDIVRGELLRVNRIVEEFLLSTKAGMAMERQVLRPIIEEVVTMLREKAAAAGIEITDDTGGEIMLECQKERLKQVFYNLITNSIEAMTAGGSIQICAEVQNPHVRISIKDTGPGIHKEDLSKIFEYYYTTKDKGIGLGVPISYMIVKDHGGDIQVLSEGGKGTTFVITLPLAKKGT
ncbi:MAG: Sensor protein ZraS [Syntrophorhabdaceae bacterium PtaU1.Bin034]|nr:MAG: Sensor protein ZraS [Syntrophorhabdaceae bacterium PtaU1.Bin034]